MFASVSVFGSDIEYYRSSAGEFMHFLTMYQSVCK